MDLGVGGRGHMQKPPEKSTARELTEQAVIGAAGMVPIVGSPVAVAFAVAMGWSYNKRMRAWLEDLAEAVSQLQEAADEPLTFEDLANNDVFTDAVVNASRAAQATHQEEKLRALKNGVLHSIGPDAPSSDEQARVVRLIEDFTPAHLRLLSFLADPGAAFDAAGIPRPSYFQGSPSQLLEDGMPEFRGQRDWYELLAADLGAASLLSRGLGGLMTSSGLWQSSTSAMGMRFLRFVSDR
jgi:hypothetical protein